VSLTLRRKILVVDDEDDFRASIVMILEAEGWEVREARDGAEALALLRKWDPAIMMLDWRMPVMDGAEVLRQLERHPRRPRIVLVTASAQRSELARQHGIRFHLAKPFEMDNLLQLLEDAHGAK
jgi:two-component system response regulator (stage 0 sporulation protein F)